MAVRCGGWNRKAPRVFHEIWTSNWCNRRQTFERHLPWKGRRLHRVVKRQAHQYWGDGGVNNKGKLIFLHVMSTWPRWPTMFFCNNSPIPGWPVTTTPPTPNLARNSFSLSKVRRYSSRKRITSARHPRARSLRVSTRGRYLYPSQFATSCNLSSRGFFHIAWCRVSAASPGSVNDESHHWLNRERVNGPRTRRRKKPLTRSRIAWQSYKDMNISIKRLLPHIGNVFHFAQLSIIASWFKKASSNSLLRILIVENINLQM